MGSSEAAIETSTFTESALPTSIFVSADPIFVAPTTAVLHPSTTASQTTTVAGGEATGIPDPTAFHCGVHGLPIGLYKMASIGRRERAWMLRLRGVMSSVRPIARDASPTRSTMRKGLVTRDVISSVVACQIAWIALFRRFRGCGTT